jgi:hypothetical protein
VLAARRFVFLDFARGRDLTKAIRCGIEENRKRRAMRQKSIMQFDPVSFLLGTAVIALGWLSVHQLNRTRAAMKPPFASSPAPPR